MLRVCVIALLLALSAPNEICAQGNAIIEGGSKGTIGRPTTTDKLPRIPGSSCLTGSGQTGIINTSGTCVADPSAYQGGLGGPIPTCALGTYWNSERRACVKP